MFEFYNTIKRYKHENNKYQYFVTTLEKWTVLILILSVRQNNPDHETNKKNKCKNELAL